MVGMALAGYVQRQGGRMRRTLCGLILLLAAWMASANDTPNTAFSYSDAAVNAFTFDNVRGYLGGVFSQFTTGSVVDFRHRLAALEPVSGGILPNWHQTQVADAIVEINALVVSKDGRTLFVGGDFSQFSGLASTNIAAVDAPSGAVLPWAPAVDGVVRTMALAPDGTTLYIGGDFLNVAGASRAHLAALTTSQGSLTPWSADTDLTVRTMAVTSDGGAMFIGGDFTRVSGLGRAHLARVNVSNGQADSWQADTDSVVRQLRISPDGADLYVAGDFTLVQSQAKAHLAKVSTSSPATLAAWGPGTDAPVETLALSRDDQMVFIGGTFTSVGTSPRARLAAVDTTNGAVALWNPGSGSAITRIGALEVTSDDALLFVGGDFSQIGGNVLSGMAVFEMGPPVTTLSPPAGGYSLAQDVSMSCLDNSGNPCVSIRYTDDGSDPRVSATALTYAAPIHISGPTKTVRYAGLDADGRQEAATTARFYIDGTAPNTTPSLNGGSYGKSAITAVTLTCQDELDGSGCDEIYFSGDGSEPTIDLAHQYLKAIDLTAFLTDSTGDGTVTLKYFSVDKTGNQEGTNTAVYTLDQNAPVVTADPLGATYSGPVDVTLTCDDQGGSGCKDIYYTLDGSKPSDGTVPASDGVSLVPPTTRYTGPIHLTGGAPVSVFVIDNAGNSATSLLAIYSFNANRADSRHGLAALDYPILLMLAGLVVVRRFVIAP